MRPHRNNTAAFKKLRLAVLNRDGWTCVYCGQYGDRADHVIPASKGGPDTMENLVTACAGCNRAKSDKMPGQQTTWVNPKWR